MRHELTSMIHLSSSMLLTCPATWFRCSSDVEIWFHIASSDSDVCSQTSTMLLHAIAHDLAWDCLSTASCQCSLHIAGCPWDWKWQSKSGHTTCCHWRLVRSQPRWIWVRIGKGFCAKSRPFNKKLGFWGFGTMAVPNENTPSNSQWSVTSILIIIWIGPAYPQMFFQA